jgi:REP element-mobilizing transposase RayT
VPLHFKIIKIMRKSRWLAPWKDSFERPVLYHVVTRVVDRRFAFGKEEKEQFRTYMRMYENFSGCRVLSYCVMCNHVHLLLEVPPMQEGGLSDEELLKRLKAIYTKAYVASVAKELAEAREKMAAGLGGEKWVAEVHARYAYRMHDLGEFMKVLLLRFSRWFNTKHKRTGALWESRYKSVLVEEGVTAQTMAAYIDLNPVRAGMVADPAEYRWSSYGEAMGGGARGDGAKARAGLVRAMLAHKGGGADPKLWAKRIAREYRMMLLEEGKEQLEVVINPEGEQDLKVVKKGMKRAVADEELARLERGRNVALRKMLRFRVRYFTDGAVIGSRAFVDEVFRDSREHFGPNRKTGARKMRGAGSAAAGMIWSARDLRKEIG